MSVEEQVGKLKPAPASEQKFHELPSTKSFMATRAADLLGKSCCLTVANTGRMRCAGKLFVKDYEGDLDMTNFAFLIEHQRDKVFFDLGLRHNKDYKNQDFVKRFNVQCDETAAELIAKVPNVTLDSCKTIIFSHLHTDHIGNLAEYPRDTKIVLGPMRNQPDRAQLAKMLQVDESVLGKREVRFLSREKDKWVDIGCFKGHDYYGDASLFLLDTPGHFDGHISALVRTDANAYHLLAGDAAHHISLIDADDPASIGVFPAKDNPASDQTDPNALKTFEDDLAASRKTMAGLARMDQEPNICIWLMHDRTMGQPLLSGNVEKLGGDGEELAGFKGRNRKGITRDSM